MHNRKSSIFEFNKALIAYKFVTFDLSAFSSYIFNVLSCYFIYTRMTKYPVVQLRWISTIARKR